MLTDQAVWFASPASFNDPFDCRVPFRFDLLEIDGARTRIMQYVRRAFPQLDESSIREKVAMIEREHKSMAIDGSSRSRAWEEQSETIQKGFGILSFAGKKENVLLWSHYSSCHQGFCVVFDGHRLARDFVNRVAEPNPQFIDFIRVEYCVDMPIVVPQYDEEADLESYKRLITCKSRDWAYEDESRFVLVGKTNQEVQISKDTIVQVILGAQMPTEHIEQIVEVLRMHLPETEIVQAKTVSDKYILSFGRLGD